jgi:hypothetical protein
LNHFQPLYTTFLQKSLILGLFQGFLDYQMANSAHQGLFVNICKSVVYETGILKWGDCPCGKNGNGKKSEIQPAARLRGLHWAA